MNKTEQKEVKLQIALPAEGFRKSLYFNAFRIQREAGFCLLQFGLTTKQGLVDSYSCVLTEEALKRNRDSLTEYLSRMGPPLDKPQALESAIRDAKVDVADIIGMSFSGELAETCFFLFSMHAAHRSGKPSETKAALPGQALALLRSSKELQKQLIVEMYEQ